MEVVTEPYKGQSEMLMSVPSELHDTLGAWAGVVKR